MKKVNLLHRKRYGIVGGRPPGYKPITDVLAAEHNWGAQEQGTPLAKKNRR
ncbi:hypothetical protein [Niastella koreensis]|uniref:hypothetical protein n=1 Tax=Niastella koreensis TaxID=354356 RepID=UPI0013FE49E1|nr:hypothetical protein [Niastella koreensis]